MTRLGCRAYEALVSVYTAYGARNVYANDANCSKYFALPLILYILYE